MALIFPLVKECASITRASRSLSHTTATFRRASHFPLAPRPPPPRRHFTDFTEPLNSPSFASTAVPFAASSTSTLDPWAKGKDLAAQLLAAYKSRGDPLSQVVKHYHSALTWHRVNPSAHMNVDPDSVYANEDVCLADMDVIGFDYDYTLVSYTVAVEKFIYREAQKLLVHSCNYPKSLLSLSYDPDFPVRGLLFDPREGLLLKLDYHNRIQSNAAYHGHTNVSKQHLLKRYPNLMVSDRIIPDLKALDDLFCKPEIALIADIIQHMKDNQIGYSPQSIVADVTRSVRQIHMSGQLHGEISSNLSLYIRPNPGLSRLLLSLKEGGKKIFLASNSRYSFIDHGMKYLTKGNLPEGVDHWSSLFDIILTQCNKPLWFTLTDQPFRILDTKRGHLWWTNVSETDFRQAPPGFTLVEGCLQQFVEMTGWKDERRVLYFGDHIINDLREPSRQGWMTGVIIEEIRDEVKINNSVPCKSYLTQLIETEAALRQCMMLNTPDALEVARRLLEFRNELRLLQKHLHNKYFGSPFRTHHTTTLFASQLERYVHVYTSKLENFNKFPLNYIHSHHRRIQAHESAIVTYRDWLLQNNRVTAEDFDNQDES